jgi:EF-P beta-lysylation protein EpmB
MTKLWKKQLKSLINDVEILWELLALPKEFLPQAKKATALFPLRLPLSFLQRIKHGDLNDPLLKQIVPWHLELKQQPQDFTANVLKETSVNHIPGLLHKYYGRVLLILSGACAINCRYCFRRNFSYQENILHAKNVARIVDYCKNDPSISEIILSGGDPLTLNDEVLAKLILPLNEIEHIQTLRIHTRIPVVLPARIDEGFLKLMQQSRLNKVIVIHSNHAQELNEEVFSALALLRKHSIHLLNQSVLLKGVNDNAQALIDLSQQLFRANVLPYYLHLLDRENYTAHFEVALSEAQELLWQMMQHLPGYLVPKLAREIPGLRSKWIYQAHCKIP